MDKNFWCRYLMSVSDRLHVISLISAFFFWIIGVPVMTNSFSGTIVDIAIIAVGVTATVFSTICPTSFIIERSINCSSEYAKKLWFCDLLNNIQMFAVLQIIAGGIVFLQTMVSDDTLTYAIVPEAFGLIGIFILLFCPSSDNIEY